MRVTWENKKKNLGTPVFVQVFLSCSYFSLWKHMFFMFFPVFLLSFRGPTAAAPPSMSWIPNAPVEHSGINS